MRSCREFCSIACKCAYTSGEEPPEATSEQNAIEEEFRTLSGLGVLLLSQGVRFLEESLDQQIMECHEAIERNAVHGMMTEEFLQLDRLSHYFDELKKSSGDPRKAPIHILRMGRRCFNIMCMRTHH